MNRENVTEIVTGIVSTILKCEESAEISRASCKEWDSLNHVEIVFSLEERFGFQFRRAHVEELDSVSSLVDEILDLLASEETL